MNILEEVKKINWSFKKISSFFKEREINAEVKVWAFDDKEGNEELEKEATRMFFTEGFPELTVLMAKIVSKKIVIDFFMMENGNATIQVSLYDNDGNPNGGTEKEIECPSFRKNLWKIFEFFMVGDDYSQSFPEKLLEKLK